MKILKTLFIVISFFVLFSATAKGFVYGDTDNNGKVESEDARKILRAAVALEDIPGEMFDIFDCDKDGVISASDARTALRISVELEESSESIPDKGFDGINYTIVDVSQKLYTYSEMEKDLQLLQELMPSRFSFTSKTTTSDGRYVYCAVLGSGHGKKQIIVDAGMHGCEYLNPAAVMSAVEYCLKNYDNEIYNKKTVREILYDTDIYIFPMLNPDGIAISQFGLKGLNTEEARDRVLGIYNSRFSEGKTYDTKDNYFRLWKANANGVDLNRNFSFALSGMEYNTGVTKPANKEFSGDRTKPENETTAYCSLINSLSNPVAVLSIHSQGNLIYWDCNQSKNGKTQAKKLAETVSKVTGYYLDMSDSFVGASADWTMIEKGIPSVTVECGRGKNPLNLSQQTEISKKLRNLFLATALLYDNNQN